MGIAGRNSCKKTRYLLFSFKEFGRVFLAKLHSISSDFIRNGIQIIACQGLISISFKGYKSDILMAKLDRKNIAVSNGSACNTGNIKPSNILKENGYRR